MNTTGIKYSIKTATENEIFSHLTACNKNFLPPLSDRTDISLYAKKLFENAISFEAWHKNILVGLIAAYFDSAVAKKGFITNVSVTEKYMGKGVASVLLIQCIEYAGENNCFEIDLEVYKDNVAAINFYKKHNFIQSGFQEDNLVLKLEIKH